jgi:alcohol dehydrogenase YqhD (iron-dependent ADH family)
MAGRAQQVVVARRVNQGAIANIRKALPLGAPLSFPAIGSEAQPLGL